MAQIDTKGLEAADLKDTELNILLDAEKRINQNNNSEVYLLAIKR